MCAWSFAHCTAAALVLIKVPRERATCPTWVSPWQWQLTIAIEPRHGRSAEPESAVVYNNQSNAHSTHTYGPKTCSRSI